MANSRLNLTQYIKPQRIPNTNAKGQYDKDFSTTDRVWIPSFVDLVDKSVKERMKSATDFALFNGTSQARYSSTSDYIPASPYQLRDSDCNILANGNTDKSAVNIINEQHTTLYGLIPCLSLDIEALQNNQIDLKIFQNLDKTEHLILFGEYPNKKVSNELNSKLEQLFIENNSDSELKCTGRTFTIPTEPSTSHYESFLTSLVPEYELNGQRYIRRVLPYSYQRGNKEFHDGSINRLESGEAYWFSVKPLTFKITNWEQLPQSINPYSTATNVADTINLESTESVINNIIGAPHWQASIVRLFLNSAKSSEVDGNPQYKFEKDWDFSKNGFLYEAFDLTREPISEYTVPENEDFIPENAFNGCRGIKKINIHNNIVAINSKAFAGLDNVQICIDYDSPNIFRTPASTFEGCKLKYIYVDNECKVITLSTHIVPELEETSQTRMDFSHSLVKTLFNPNFKKNYTKLTRLKREKKIKFIPPQYTMLVFPSEEIDKYFINNNNIRWGKLVKTLGFDTLPIQEKDNSLIDLMKIYYAIGGFSTNQGESEKAYDYILKYVAVSRINDQSVNAIGAEIHSRFDGFQLDGPFNPTFAQFFMKYYKDNPNFMNLSITDHNDRIFAEQDYLSIAHNNFGTILKNYPNRVVNGNETRSLLTPEFVAHHCGMINYFDIHKGNAELANTISRYGYSQNYFEKIQEIYDQAKEKKDTRFIRIKQPNETQRISYRILEKDDPLGFVIGDITNCCQTINGQGADCVEDGFLNPNAGFLIFEENLDEGAAQTTFKRIIGQAYIWYDPITKTVCYDNIEIPTKVHKDMHSSESKINTEMLIKAIDDSAEAIMEEMNKDEIVVERVTIGEGYNELNKDLIKHYHLEKVKKAQHRGYSGYTDAKHGQFIIKYFDKVTNMYSRFIQDTIKESQMELQNLISEMEGNVV